MTAEPRFVCDFLEFTLDNSPHPEKYKPYFMNYDSLEWKNGGGGGFFKFFDMNHMVYTLLITDDARYGIMLTYEQWDNTENKPVTTFYSVGDKTSLNQIIENQDNFSVPLGVYLKPHKAWYAVEDFLTNPCVISSSINWINANNIVWPNA